MPTKSIIINSMSATSVYTAYRTSTQQWLSDARWGYSDKTYIRYGDMGIPDGSEIVDVKIHTSSISWSPQGIAGEVFRVRGVDAVSGINQYFGHSIRHKCPSAIWEWFDVDFAYCCARNSPTYPARPSSGTNELDNSGTQTLGQMELVVTYNIPYTAFTPPSSVVVSPNSVPPGGSATLSWSGWGGGNNVSLAKFNIYSSTDGVNFSYIAETTATSCTVTASNTPNTTWYYKVQVVASNATYNSGLSGAASITSTVTAVGAPTAVWFDDTSTSPPSETRTLKWSGASNGVNNPITSYRILRSTTQGSEYTSIGSTSATSIAVTSPASNGVHYYKVEAVGTYLASQTSSAIASFTTDFSAPSIPTGLAVSTAVAYCSQNVTLSWAASSNGTNNAVSSYTILRSISETGTYIELKSVAANTTSTTVVSHELSGRSYFYKVVAVGAYASSAQSSHIELKTVIGTIAQPTDVKINDTTSITTAPSTHVTLTWSAASDAVNNSVTGYAIMSSTTALGTYVQMATTQATTYSLTTPNNEGTVYYRIKVLGERANSEQSTYVQQTVSLTTAMATEVSLSSSSVIAGGSVGVTLTPPDGAGS